MRFHKKVRILALVMVLLLTATAGAETFQAVVTAGAMAVYADAALTWPIGWLPMTTVVTVQSYADGVAQISAGGNVGYAAASDMAALDSIATRVVVNTGSRVYQQPSLSSRWGALPKGMELNLLATNGPWAMVENGGVVAYTNAAHLSPKQTEAQPEAPAADPVVQETFAAQVTSDAMLVYQSASDGSRCLGMLPKGATVTVHAYNAEWAYIELNGCFGFARIADMTRAAASQPQPEPEPEPVQPDNSYLTDSGYSVEQIIYLFLTREMKLNRAAACGILANVERECSFKVTNASYDGGYGICQWTGARNTRLKNWCKDNGLDYTTLEGQLWYLKYELENLYPKILSELRSVEDSPAGAYAAGHYFCYNFEIPASRASRSVERGNLAKDKYWPRYAAV